MKRYIFLIAAAIFSLNTFSISKTEVQDSITSLANSYARIGKVKVSRLRQSGNSIDIYASKQLSGAPFTTERVSQMHRLVSRMTLGHERGKVRIFTDGREIAEYVRGASGSRFTRQAVTPLHTNTSIPYSAPKGLSGRHIAMYGSHGIYYNQSLDLWKWQRAKLLTTVEDVYTTAYTMPFLVPMLENAGAVVLQPRERDTHSEELVVDDADCRSTASWTRTTTDGFGQLSTPLLEKDNPFTMGGYSYIDSKKQNAEPLRYIAAMPTADEYAVYISYKSLPNSTSSAHYRIVHEGIETAYSVNQTMGGSTWIYLGTFRFGSDAARNYVEVSPTTGDGKTVTSDAIKIGGGIGNVARYRSLNIAENVKSSDDEGLKALLEKPLEQYSPADSLRADSVARLSAYTSGYPRWLEGARYFLQYSGIPDSVYNFSNSMNDYTDDYASRGRWANYLAGGSEVFPKGPGLSIPIDLFLAFHSDAGITPNDSVIGTLIIYTDFDDEKKTLYETGASRMAARDYADYVQSQIVDDMRRLYAPEWQRRELRNSSYAESRNPKMPAVLLELLSHQNIADMRYGLDPRVRFSVSRAIYKGMLKFISKQYGTDYAVQPLPVRNFAIRKNGAKLQLSWDEQTDTLEATAQPTYFVVYTRRQGSDWDNGIKVGANSYSFTPEEGVRYDFYVAAGNKGGLSMPSEVLSACLFANSPLVLVVNGFTRLSAPDSYADSVHGGFLPESYGVPYKKDVCYIGSQYEFRRALPWQSDDDTGAGGCYGDQALTTMAGNMFDYPVMHGKVLQKMRISYVSASISSFAQQKEENNISPLAQYDAIDIILGKQKQTTLGTEKLTTDFKTFPEQVQERIIEYTSAGGRLLVSGAYIGGDMKDDKADREFLRRVLHADFASSHATRTGQIQMRSQFFPTQMLQLQTTPDEHLTVSENPDGLQPYGENAKCIARFFDTQVPAGVLWQAGENEKTSDSDSDTNAKTIVFAFPLESVHQFDQLYQQSITFLLD